MAITRLQHAGASGETVAFGSNVTSGSLLVLCYTGAEAPAPTDSLGNTWIKFADEPQPGVPHFCEIWYCISASSGANTVDANTLYNFGYLWVAEYSGVDGTPADKATSQNWADSGSLTVFDSGNTATTSQADELLIGLVSCTNTSATHSWDSPWTALLDSTGTYRTISVAERIVAATGAYKASGTNSTSVYWAAAIATFKASAGTSGKGILRRFLRWHFWRRK